MGCAGADDWSDKAAAITASTIVSVSATAASTVRRTGLVSQKPRQIPLGQCRI